MANYNTLKTAIADVIKTNGNNEITGEILQQVLLSMINSLGAGYQFAGLATVSTNPGTPDQRVFYIATTPGTYSNFNGQIVKECEFAVFKYSGTWDCEITPVAKDLYDILVGIPDVDSPTQSDIQSGKYLYDDGDSNAHWVASESSRYIMFDISDYRGKTLVDLNSGSNDVQFAFVKSYDNTNAKLCGNRTDTRFQSGVIPYDATYIYMLFPSAPQILPVFHIEESGTGLIELISEIVTAKQIEKDTVVTELSQGITAMPGYYISYGSPFWRELAGYNSWYFVAQKNCKIYCDDPNIYFIAIFNNGDVSTANYVLRMERNGTGQNALPTQENPYNVTAGQLIAISCYNYSTMFSLNVVELIDGKELADDVYLGETQLEQVRGMTVKETDDMFVKKTATSIDIFRKIGTSPFFAAFHYGHRQKGFTENEYPSFYDNWGLMGSSIVKIENGAISTILAQLYGSEAELAVNVVNPNGGYKYVGGWEHGFDNIITDANGDRNFIITIDNIAVAENSAFDLRPAGKVVIESMENLYQAYTNTNPFALVYKKFEFSNNGIFITNKMELLRSMDFANAQFGMMCLWRRYLGNANNPYLIYRAIRDNQPFHIYVVDDAWKESGVSTGIGATDHATTKITEYGELGVGFALSVKESTLKPNGGMKVWHNGGGFDKIYFDMTGAYSAAQNEILSAVVEWEIYGNPIDPESV